MIHTNALFAYAVLILGEMASVLRLGRRHTSVTKVPGYLDRSPGCLYRYG